MCDTDPTPAQRIKFITTRWAQIQSRLLIAEVQTSSSRCRGDGKSQSLESNPHPPRWTDGDRLLVGTQKE